jgi:hypothetical protein
VNLLPTTPATGIHSLLLIYRFVFRFWCFDFRMQQGFARECSGVRVAYQRMLVSISSTQSLLVVAATPRAVALPEKKRAWHPDAVLPSIVARFILLTYFHAVEN